MQCQVCGKHPANTHMKTIVNGTLTEQHLCAVCAQNMGYGTSLFQNNTFDQFFSSFFGKKPAPEDTVRCSTCGASLADISRTGKVGCADCYRLFLKQLTPSIQRMHGNTRHIGKTPAGTALQPAEPNLKTEVERDRERLQQAIAEQDFELAAKLRDKLKAAEQGGKEVTGDGEKMV